MRWVKRRVCSLGSKPTVWGEPKCHGLDWGVLCFSLPRDLPPAPCLTSLPCLVPLSPPPPHPLRAVCGSGMESEALWCAVYVWYGGTPPQCMVVVSQGGPWPLDLGDIPSLTMPCTPCHFPPPTPPRVEGALVHHPPSKDVGQGQHASPGLAGRGGEEERESKHRDLPCSASSASSTLPLLPSHPLRRPSFPSFGPSGPTGEAQLKGIRRRARPCPLPA